MFAWLVILLLSLILYGDARSNVWLHFFHLPPCTEREKNHLNIAHCFCRQRESNPGRRKWTRYPLFHCLSGLQDMFLTFQPSFGNESRTPRIGFGAGKVRVTSASDTCRTCWPSEPKMHQVRRIQSGFIFKFRLYQHLNGPWTNILLKSRLQSPVGFFTHASIEK